jgi:penicillin-binding protein 1A
MSARSRRRRRVSSGSAGKKLIVALSVVLAAVGIALAGAALWVLDIASGAPSINTLRPADSGTNSQILDASGKSLGYVQSDVLREPTKLKRVPEILLQATIAVEDENFYQHGGVDYIAVIRAGLENLEAGEVRQGASTITQQLVRNLYIEDPEDTIERKIIEAAMAREYEQEFGKDEILETYLNTATYGTNNSRTAIGVEAASQVFFDKNVKQLDIKESALLAGLPQAPSDYNPFLNPDVATERRNLVLDAMFEQGYITKAKAATLKKQGLGLERGYRYEQRDEQFFFDFVQQELVERYGAKAVRQGGLTVFTTLEPELQAAAQQAIVDNPVTSAASALVSTNTKTGEILAMASSSTYDSSQFNLAAQGERQPGSAFKPFVLTTAVDEGIDPDKTRYPAPSTITLTPDKYSPPWTVTGGGGGAVDLRQATARSINTVYAQLGVDVGPEDFTAMATRLGITSPLDGFYAEALGGTTKCCSVLEMSNAFASLANGGVHHDPTAIRRVELPDGEVDEDVDLTGERVITDGVAYTVVDIMKGTLDYGTAAGNDISCPAAGKTGTTEEQADAWFIGYTPEVSTAVWTGNPDERLPLPGYGASLSAPIWQAYMEVAATEPCNDFPDARNPADLAPYNSGQAASSEKYDEDGNPIDPDAPELDENGDPITDENGDPITDGVDSDGDGFPDEAYAPGVEPETPPEKEKKK